MMPPFGPANASLNGFAAAGQTIEDLTLLHVAKPDAVLGSVSGRVQMPGGVGAAGVIVAQDVSTGFIQNATGTDGDGNFVLAGLPTGVNVSIGAITTDRRRQGHAWAFIDPVTREQDGVVITVSAIGSAQIEEIRQAMAKLCRDPVMRLSSIDLGRRIEIRSTRELLDHRDPRDWASLPKKQRNGFGRGIAAPQIGVCMRVIFIDVHEPMVLINPSIVRRSAKTFLLWDDCFSFPDLLVRVERHFSIEVRYQNELGENKRLKASGPLSELRQHEIDHLDGVLAVDRALDSKHIILRSERGKFVTRRS